jgi:predicted phosphodiesterase
MRYLILSDIHANIQALDAVLEDAAGVGWDACICLGDLVGYGADSAAVLQRIRELAPQWLVRGNHDRVCAGLTSSVTFSPTARVAIEWTRATLSDNDLAMLAALPAGPLVLDADVLLCHGAPHDEDMYVLDTADARLAMSAHRASLCLHGHTHAQTVFSLSPQGLSDVTPARRRSHAITLAPDARWLVNPGSVGQPRDRDSRAAYAVWDGEAGTMDLRRVTYDVPAAQAAIRRAGLPDALARRLASGE